MSRNCFFRVTLCAIALVAGCARAKPAAQEQQQLVTSYALLAKTKQTHHAGLRDELTRLQTEAALPEQLAKQASTKGLSNARGLTSALAKAFPAHELEFALLQTQQPLPSALQLAPLELERARQFRARFAPAQTKIRAALARYAPEVQIDFSAGLMADLTCVDAARVAARLEAITAAESLAAGRTDETLAALQHIAQLIEAVNQAPNLTCRLTAAAMRGDELAVLAALADDPRYGREVAVAMRDVVDRQLATWPATSQLWIADRAQGMHTCEMVRDGQLLSLLSEDELAKYREETHLWTLNAAVMRGIDDDEYFYLVAMRRLIDASPQPLPEQLTIAREIRANIEELRPSSKHPLVTETLLLRGLESALTTLAADRAECEAWAIALAKSLGDEPPTALSPLSGQPHSVHVEDGKVAVDFGGEHPVRIPLPLGEGRGEGR